MTDTYSTPKNPDFADFLELYLAYQSVHGIVKVYLLLKLGADESGFVEGGELSVLRKLEEALAEVDRLKVQNGLWVS